MDGNAANLADRGEAIHVPIALADAQEDTD